MIIIPRACDAAKVRLEIKKKMAAEGADVVLVPKFATLYDVALDIAGIEKGKVIMKEDFFCLLDQVEELPDKFKGNNRSYKSAIFSLLNQMAFLNEDLAGYPFCKTAEAAGLTPGLCKKIYEIVRERGFLFRAEVYLKALDAVKKAGTAELCDEYFIVPGEYYTKVENELMQKLSVKPYSPEVQAFKPSSDRIGFLKAGSEIEQYTAARDHILAKMAADGSLDYDDFCIVTGTEDSLATCTAYYSSTGFPCVSAASVPKEDLLLDNLNLLSYSIGGQTEKLVLYYNRHNRSDMVSCDGSYEFPVLEIFCEKLKGSRYDNISDDFKSWIGRYRIENANEKRSAKDALEKLQKILDRLRMGEHSLYEYEKSIEDVFGNTKISTAELIEYFINILSGRGKNHVSQLNDGIVVAKMGSYIPSCKFIYFLDLEERTFLKDTAPNRLLSKEEHDDFNRAIYGLTKEEHLKKSFEAAASSAERLFFVIPQYDEGTVVSEYVEDLLLEFPEKRCRVQILGGCGEAFDCDFPPAFDDVGFENGEPFCKCSSDGNLHTGFEVKVNDPEKKPIDFVVSKAGTATGLEAFMSCPARFVYERQLPSSQLSDEGRFEAGNALHDFCKKIFSRRMSFCLEGIDVKDLDCNIAAYILENPCDPKMKELFDRADVKGIFASVKESYPEIELGDQDLLKYLKFICRAFWRGKGNSGPLCNVLPDSFRTEVFVGNSDILEEYGIKIAESYIDLMAKSADGSVILLDYKAGDIKKYREDIKNCQNVQLLLYSSIVKNALKSGDMSVFKPNGHQLEKVNMRSGTVLEEGYFDGVESSAFVDPFYVSPKGDSCFSCVPGVDPDLADPFGAFKERLSALLNDAKDNVFSACAFSKCSYCQASSFCSEAEQGDAAELYEKLDLKPPFTAKFPLPETQKSERGGDETVKIICFDGGDKMEAVTNTADDILISAGAGAGKTEVLTSRYLNLLLNTDAAPEDILCITFTDKAAGEMKKRIVKKIKETLILGRFYSVPDAPPLSESQIAKLTEAKRSFFSKNRISTFHSFCLDMLKKYEKEDKDSKRDLVSAVADDYIMRGKKVEIFKNAIENCRKKSEVFARWVEYQRIYARLSDTEVGLVTNFIDLLETYKLSGLSLDEATGAFLSCQFEARKLRAQSEFGSKYEENKKKLLDALSDLLDSETEKRAIKTIEKEIADIEAGKLGSDTRSVYKENPELRALFKSLKGNPVDADEGLSTEEERSLHDAIFDVLAEADRKIEEYKQKNGFIELSDYHLDFIKILSKESIRDRIKSGIKFIMVDEFQDTNWLQKKILDMLHDDSNRLFIVGDLKQSIYRFQQCDNQIFKYYRQHGRMKYLTFCENFRSVSDIVDFNNAYFSKNQTAEYDIVDRDELAIPVKKSSKNSDPAVSFVKIAAKNLDAEISKAERNALIRLQEAAFIARTIQAAGSENYGRWGILIRSYSHAEVIIDALAALGIPHSFIIKKDFFTQEAVVQTIQILKVVYGYSSPEVLLPMPELLDIAKSVDAEMISRGFGYVVSRVIAHRRFVSVYSILSEFLLKCRELAKKSAENIEDIFCELAGMADENCGEISTSLPNSVRIMTVHSSKGLEFDYLFLSKVTPDENNRDKSAPLKFVNFVEDSGDRLVDFAADSLKTLDGESSKFVYSKWMQDIESGFDAAERGNLLYVAFTRAKKHLVVTIQDTSSSEKTLGSDISWYRNIVGNLFEGDFNCERCKRLNIEAESIEPIDGSGYSECEYPYEMLELEPPKLIAQSVSHYLESIDDGEHDDHSPRISEPEDDCADPDLDISDPDDDARTRGKSVGTFVHLFFEKNIRNLHSTKLEDFYEQEKISEKIRKRIGRYVNAGLKNDDLRKLADGADALLTETEIFFKTSDKRLWNGVIDLVVRKGDTVTVLDYKTCGGSDLDDAKRKRYGDQVRFYADGLSKLPAFKGLKFECKLFVMYSDGTAKMDEAF